MSTKADQLVALARVCRDFGGRLAIVSQRTFDDLFHNDSSNRDWTWNDEELSDAPFTSAHGLWWRRKIIYAVNGREEVGTIIHEMGHVFAAPHHPFHECGECHEWNWFGWEIALARKIDAVQTWSRHNANYNTGEGGGGQWSRLSADRRKKIVADRLATARKIGVIAPGGEPRSVR